MGGKLGKWGSKIHLLLKKLNKLNKSCYTDKRILRLSFFVGGSYEKCVRHGK